MNSNMKTTKRPIKTKRIITPIEYLTSWINNNMWVE